MLHDKFPLAVEREFEIDSEEHWCFKNLMDKLLQGRNVMFRRRPGMGEFYSLKVPRVGNLTLAPMKMSNSPGSSPPSHPGA